MSNKVKLKCISINILSEFFFLGKNLINVFLSCITKYKYIYIFIYIYIYFKLFMYCQKFYFINFFYLEIFLCITELQN